MQAKTGTAGLKDRPSPGPGALDYRILFDAAPSPYVVLTPDFTIVDANAAYCAATLRAREDVLGRNLFTAFPSGPDDPNGESVAQVRGSLERALHEKRVDHLPLVKYDIPAADGSGFEQRYWSATHTPILAEDGSVAFLLQLTVNVTDLHRQRGGDAKGDDSRAADLMRRANAVQQRNTMLEADRDRLRRLFEQAPGFMALLTGPDHVFEMANAAYGQIIGHREVVGLSVREALPEVVDQGLVDLLDQVLASGEPFIGNAMRVMLQQSPDGPLTESFLDFIYQPILDAEGQPAGIFVQGQDVTQRKQAEDALLRLTEHLEQRVMDRTGELQQARNALQAINRNLEGIVKARMADLHAANEEIQRFAYIISHDLRSPLVNIMGFTAELEAVRDSVARVLELAARHAPGEVTAELRQAVEEDLPEAIGFIRSSSERMDRLIKAILRLSREGRRVLTPELINLRNLLSSSIDAIAHQLDESGATLLIGDMPELTSDRLALEQVFGNLIENALKYLDPSRPGVIRVHGREDGPNVVISVEDNGRGIEERDFERIFDLFRRAGAQDRPGEGIGLAHVRALVRRLGGSISVTSAIGAGSTFEVTLPKVLATSSEFA
ncbi:PAS domain-containing protein [Alsobacter sp. SYSU M60028]|uniref:histidine kinase n=1 Tax=Alsobacter ponti TaxID=2962936 RepID=A0ABT1LC37_9HYPH|nr:ATP-binding protein [Alsobacter ponti]MCP8938636.1 PAS domain-containing protein [Alsobacter ponti]